MAISKQKKGELIAQYVEQLKKSQGVILTDYRGLTVSDVHGLRRGLRPLDVKFQVVKNRLLMLALKEAGMSLPEEWLTGPTAVGFCYKEVPPAAKYLRDAMRDLEALRFKGALVGSSLIAADGVQALADLPPREVVLAQILGTIQCPAGRVAGVVANGIRQVLNVLQAYVDKLEGAPHPA